jgi:hypothetical protein
MKSKSAVGWCMLFASLIVACGQREDTPDMPDGSGSVDAATVDLSGTWDVIASNTGTKPYPLTVTIDSQHVEVVTGDGSFTVQQNGSGFLANYASSAIARPIAVTRNAMGAMVFGAIPLDLSGSWTARITNTVETIGCDGTLSESDVAATCRGVRFPSWMGGYRVGTGAASGTKAASAASIFGDLGGTWRVDFASGATCTFRFEGSTFSSDCGRELGGVTVTFAGSNASGSTTFGDEFSAHRR